MLDKALIIFAKAPIKDIVKTRLKGYLSDDERLRLYIWLLERIIKETSGKNLYEPFIAYTPASGKVYFMPYGHKCFSQTDGDLGERMKNVFEKMFREGFKKVIICGVDIPELTSDIIEEAFERLLLLRQDVKLLLRKNVKFM